MQVTDSVWTNASRLVRATCAFVASVAACNSGAERSPGASAETRTSVTASGSTSTSATASTSASTSTSETARFSSDSESSTSTPSTAGHPLSEPCDIYQSANTPCVAAHSTVRALYASYGGALYQVRRASDSATKDVPVLSPGGFADSSVQDSFCTGTKCTIAIVYDQSPQGNHLPVSPPVHWLKNGGAPTDATAAKITVGGHVVYGVYVAADAGNSYRNDRTTGVATGDQPEAMYMVADGRRYNNRCCFDYGNVETSGNDDGNATMEALNWSSINQWSAGADNGPWVMADLENGVFAGSSSNPNVPNSSNVPTVADYVTVMLKGPSGNLFMLKAGDAQSGALAIKANGDRPPGYSPQHKEGAIELGTGGDGSAGGIGTFFEGAVTSGNPPDATDDAVQANIVAVGYGR